MSTLTVEQFRERVAATAKELDEVVPGWANDINLETFELFHTERCVVGQLGINRLYDVLDERKGFYIDNLIIDGSEENVAVYGHPIPNTIWKNEICRRRTG